MKKVIVTGGAGFVGAHLVKELISKGFEVHVIDNLVVGKRENLDGRAVLHVLDIREIETIRPIFIGASYVFHLAALPSVPYSIEHPEETHSVNLTGTLHVLLASRDAGVERVIFSSSAAVYGDQEELPVHEGMNPRPMSPYALHKLESEQYMKLFSDIYGLSTISLRYFNIYGEGQNPDGPYASAIPKFVMRKKSGKPIQIIGDGEQTRDFVHISDVVSANIAAMESEKVGKGEVINIATGKNVSMNYVANLIGGPIEHVPPRLEIKHSVAHIGSAKNLLDWEPKADLEKGISELLS
jgi:UDP-glucose 4-epimerase